MIGEKIRKRLEQQRMTVSELSERTGIARPMLYRYMTGKHEPSAGLLKKIAEALGVTCDWFFTSYIDLDDPTIRTVVEKSGGLCYEDQQDVIRYIDFVRERREKYGEQQARLPGAGGKKPKGEAK